MKFDQLIYTIAIEGVKFKITLARFIQFTSNTQLDKKGFHYHVQHELFVTTSEPTIIQFKNYTQTLKNQCITIPPFISHTTALSNTFSFGFSLSKSSHPTNNTNKLIDFFNRDVQLLKYSNSTFLYIQQLNSLFATNDYTSKEVEALLFLFFINLLKDNNLLKKASTNNSNKLNYLPFIESFIFSNYNTDVSLEKLAKELCLSKRQVSRIIQSNFNKSFSVLVSDKRLEIAALIIKNTDEPISTIIEKVNLNNESHFYSIFKKKYGCTPIEYRHKC